MKFWLAHLAWLTILLLFPHILSCCSQQQPENIGFKKKPPLEMDSRVLKRNLQWKRILELKFLKYLAGHSLLSLWSRRQQAAGVRRCQPRPTRANIGRAINQTLKPAMISNCQWLNQIVVYDYMPAENDQGYQPHAQTCDEVNDNRDFWIVSRWMLFLRLAVIMSDTLCGNGF